MGFGIRNRWI